MRIPIAVAIAITVAGCNESSPPRYGSAPPTVAPDPRLQRHEHGMFQLVNRDRAGAGLPPLTYDEALANIGRAHSDDMVRNRFFEHTSPHTGTLQNRMDRAGYSALTARENLAEAPNVEIGQKQLMLSPGHRENLLSGDITHIGIGIVSGGASGEPRNLTITQVFAKPVVAQSPASAAGVMRTQIQQARAQRNLTMASHPVLQRLAAQEVAKLPDGFTSKHLDELGSRVVGHVHLSNDRTLGSVSVLALFMVGVEQFDPPAEVLAPTAAFIDLAAAQGADAQGHPGLKVVILVGTKR